MTEPITMTAIAVGVSFIAGTAFALYAEHANIPGVTVVGTYIAGGVLFPLSGLTTGNIPFAGIGLGLLLSLLVLTTLVKLNARFTGVNPT